MSYCTSSYYTYTLSCSVLHLLPIPASFHSAACLLSLTELPLLVPSLPLPTLALLAYSPLLVSSRSPCFHPTLISSLSHRPLLSLLSSPCPCFYPIHLVHSSSYPSPLAPSPLPCHQPVSSHSSPFPFPLYPPYVTGANPRCVLQPPFLPTRAASW